MRIQEFNAELFTLDLPWQIQPVLGIAHAYALSDRGPVRAELVIEAADVLGLDDLGELDELLAPSTPRHGMAGFVLKDDDPATAAELITWASTKLQIPAPEGLRSHCR